MKKLIAITGITFLLASCADANKDNNESGKDKTETVSAKTEGTASADVKLPFSLQKPYRNWQIGSNENVVAAMGALKAFVDSDFKTLAALSGDSVELNFDGFRAKLSRDSTMAFFGRDRAKYKELNITMYDYVSVISADKSEEWVTLWYKQAWKDNKGVADSMAVTDDIMLKNGKMVELDEKTSRYPKK